MKNIRIFLSEKLSFLVVKFSVYLNRRVFVMPTPAVTSSRSSLTTVLECGNALGTQMPPYFVFQGRRMRQELLADVLQGLVVQ